MNFDKTELNLRFILWNDEQIIVPVVQDDVNFEFSILAQQLLRADGKIYF
jgi:hypothetical protein